eukprot:Rmarinus@m.7772
MKSQSSMSLRGRSRAGEHTGRVKPSITKSTAKCSRVHISSNTHRHTTNSTPTAEETVAAEKALEQAVVRRKDRKPRHVKSRYLSEKPIKNKENVRPEKQSAPRQAHRPTHVSTTSTSAASTKGPSTSSHQASQPVSRSRAPPRDHPTTTHVASTAARERGASAHSFKKAQASESSAGCTQGLKVRNVDDGANKAKAGIEPSSRCPDAKVVSSKVTAARGGKSHKVVHVPSRYQQVKIKSSKAKHSDRDRGNDKGSDRDGDNENERRGESTGENEKDATTVEPEEQASTPRTINEDIPTKSENNPPNTTEQGNSCTGGSELRNESSVSDTNVSSIVSGAVSLSPMKNFQFRSELSQLLTSLSTDNPDWTECRKHSTVLTSYLTARRQPTDTNTATPSDANTATAAATTIKDAKATPTCATATPPPGAPGTGVPLGSSAATPRMRESGPVENKT